MKRIVFFCKSLQDISNLSRFAREGRGNFPLPAPSPLGSALRALCKCWHASRALYRPLQNEILATRVCKIYDDMVTIALGFTEVLIKSVFTATTLIYL